MKLFLLMLGFLTRIPVPRTSWKIDDKKFKDGIIYFPVIGFIVGIFNVAFYFGGYLLGGSFMAAIASVLSGAVITGGLHLDGLGDTFDGLYSNRSKEKVLEIMKDSRLGTNGALAIIFVILIKTALVYVMPIPFVYPILIIMPIFSRFSMVIACKFSSYARENGLGNIFIGRIKNKEVVIALLITTLTCALHISALLLFPLTLGFTLLYIHHVKSKIDGMTGDTLGALCELMELMTLVFYGILQR